MIARLIFHPRFIVTLPNFDMTKHINIYQTGGGEKGKLKVLHWEKNQKLHQGTIHYVSFASLQRFLPRRYKVNCKRNNSRNRRHFGKHKKKNISTHLSGAKRRHDRNPHQALASLRALVICSRASLPPLRQLLRTNLKSTTKLASRQLPGCHQS